jgi:hypothetical protein
VNRPFVRLVRHFFLRFFDVDLGSAEGRLGIGAVLGILNVPGALMSMVLFAKYSSLLRWMRRDFQFDPDIASLPDKYTFLAFSIAATGIIAILRLESLFPDRRDYFNLAPMTVSMRTILLAKVTALAGFVLLFVVDVNLVSSVLFPLIVMEDHGTFAEALRFIAACGCGDCRGSLDLLRRSGADRDTDDGAALRGVPPDSPLCSVRCGSGTADSVSICFRNAV